MDAVKRKLFLTLLCVIALFMVDNAYSLQKVDIEFLYYDKFCQYCPDALKYYQAYKHNCQVIENIQRDYGENVTVEWIPFLSEEGFKKVREYGIGFSDWNCIVVNHKIVLGGGDKLVNETYLREIIDLELAGETFEVPKIVGLIASAFILGFFESFSPCVMVMLSFIVFFSLGGENSPKKGFLKVLTFGSGFVIAAIIFSLIFSLILLSMPNVRFYSSLIVCFFALFFGLNLIGVLKLSTQTKSKIRRIAKKYVFSTVGIFFLGLIFYFLDPCIAPIFASMVAILFSDVFAYALILFCLGAIIPFICAGLLVSSMSKITRKVYQYRFIFRSVSGVILIGYALALLYIMLKTL